MKTGKLKAWGEVHFLLADAILAASAAACAIGIVFYRDSSTDLARLLDGNRATAYGTIASIYASLLGFVLTAVSIVLLIGGLPRFKLLRQSKQYGAVFETFFHAVYVLAIGLIVATVGFVVDHDNGGKISLWLEAISFLTFALVVVRVWRCVALLRALALIAAKPFGETQPDA